MYKLFIVEFVNLFPALDKASFIWYFLSSRWCLFPAYPDQECALHVDIVAWAGWGGPGEMERAAHPLLVGTAWAMASELSSSSRWLDHALPSCKSTSMEVSLIN
jgi:hypothetical protein